jgi:hypothetical protein
MSKALGPETLCIIPCCAAKKRGGQTIEVHADPLAQSVSGKCYEELLAARSSVLLSLKTDSRFLMDKDHKNNSIQEGRDVGGKNLLGLYAPAIERYDGTMYSVDGFKSSVERAISCKYGPRIMILSALYGPLHPRSQIQDYNLKMSDAPARAWSNAFPPFLEEFARRNGLAKILLYVGTSTAYFKIAKKAVAALKEKGLISQAVQYHVENGNTRTTPLQHGLRLIDDLDKDGASESKRSTGIVENIL